MGGAARFFLGVGVACDVMRCSSLVEREPLDADLMAAVIRISHSGSFNISGEKCTTYNIREI